MELAEAQAWGDGAVGVPVPVLPRVCSVILQLHYTTTKEKTLSE